MGECPVEQYCVKDKGLWVVNTVGPCDGLVHPPTLTSVKAGFSECLLVRADFRGAFIRNNSSKERKTYDAVILFLTIAAQPHLFT